ncbi:MAG: hypothetical protein ABSE22_20455 [Xanthobacteraceae bacterium]|jgi:hypothetical protein
MKVILVLGMLAPNILLAVPAQAGAAGGSPSPFMSPYPDYGCNARCIIKAEREHDALLRGGAGRRTASRNPVHPPR